MDDVRDSVAEQSSEEMPAGGAPQVSAPIQVAAERPSIGSAVLQGVGSLALVGLLVLLLASLTKSDPAPAPAAPSPAALMAVARAQELNDPRAALLTIDQLLGAWPSSAEAGEAKGLRPALEQAVDARRAEEAEAQARAKAELIQRQAAGAKRAAVEAEKEAKLRADVATGERRSYAPRLREEFLDDGLDIKVELYGKPADQLILTFSLFNDVWVHKFRKGHLIRELESLGFRGVSFRDGHDFDSYIPLPSR